MFSRSKHTVLCVTNDTLARVDLTGGSSVDVVASQWAQRGEVRELADAVGRAMALGKRRGTKVWVLADDFWSGSISLAKEVVEAVGASRLEQSLALEAEFDSGMSAFDSRLAYVHQGRSSEGELSWWVTQAEASQIEAISATLARSGAKLAGVAATVGSMAAPDNAAPDNAARHDSCLTHSKSRPGDSFDHTPIDFAAMAQQWLSQVLEPDCRVPVIRPAPRQLSERQQWQVGLVAATVIFTVCYGWHASCRARQTSLSSSLSSIEQQEKRARQAIHDHESELQIVRQRIRNDESSKQAKIHQRLTLHGAAAQREATRKFPASLLQALSTTAHPEHCLTHLELSQDQAVLEGFAIHSHAIANLAQRLEDELATYGWIAWPPEMSPLESSALVQFRIVLKPNTATKAPPPPPGRGGNGADVG